MALDGSDAESLGLLALMLLHHARRATRVDAGGAALPLEAQDRSRWDRSMIDEGCAVLDEALRLTSSGLYQVQAAIAALHATAERAEATDWPQIAQLYAGLRFDWPSPVVELNAAVAHAEAIGSYRAALSLTTRDADRRYLERRLRECEQHAGSSR